MISIVDDDDFVRESLRDLIESLGYEVATFESVESFLDAPYLRETSCLITDLQMPGLSGLDLQSRLIADGHCIPVVFVTGFPDEKFRVRAMSAGAVGFLSSSRPPYFWASGLPRPQRFQTQRLSATPPLGPAFRAPV